ncbi:4-hydroxy-tetrahydrodipicolinate reductase [Vulgatibacter incomptus]|uniref:4-hydroxy-tetrahydrodipicolinate reductase n=1 Tax=Vulgatibacter incomptus TaxID=1391653 RepID=A0A0K1PED6_9BACT|nr:4-hydroxy-tetrahydrodipicolinate reductase [Vulgatibacter incomptus]AKU91771.1 4-hydroxy-tetrahydrodipicolinate reductase [Vulgatibacter incomptus]
MNVVITGIGGRMGDALLRAVRSTSATRALAGTTRPGGPAQRLTAELGLPVEESLDAALARGADAVIDFTSPSATAEHVDACVRAKLPIVIGTTGLDPETQAAVARGAKEIPVVLAPNMSVGMNLLFRLVSQATEVLGEGYDVEIVEAHHRHKKDAPSGSALRLAEAVARARGEDLGDVANFGREGQVGARPRREIGIHAVRGGDVVGDHSVLFLADGERVELAHRASSREAFAGGAVRAALWLAGHAPGLYTMQHVLGFEPIPGEETKP